MHLEALMSTPGRRNHGGIADQGVVDAGIRDQVGLELVEVDVEGTIEAQGRSDGANDLSDQAVKMVEGWARDIKTPAADVVDGLVIDKEGAIRVLDGAMGGQHGVVGLDDGSGDARSRVDGELELGLLAVLSRKTLEQKSTKARTSTTAEGVENEESLERVAVV